MSLAPFHSILAMGGGEQSQQSPLFMIGWFAIMIALFYFMLLRPQQRKEKQRRDMIAALKSGDRVVFGGGFIGIVANIKEHTLVIKIADNTKVEVVKGAVTRVLGKDDEAGQET